MAVTALSAVDEIALERLLRVRPVWHGLSPAGEILDLDRHTLLHAGPPFDTTAEISQPIMNSACVAAVYEGLVDTFEEAAHRIRNGRITLRAAQDYQVVTPLAAVLSASMYLQIVADRQESSPRAFAPINGGAGAAMRLGLCSDAALDHLHWLNGPFAEVLRLASEENLDLIDIAAKGLRAGDDGHGRTVAMTGEFAQLIHDHLIDEPDGKSAARFIEEGPSFFLNFWMAACKCILSAVRDEQGTSVVNCAGGNGAYFGIQVSGLPGQWFTHRATPPFGDLGGYPAERALGAIGDSALVDAVGFGAMAMRHAPIQQDALGRFLPSDGLSRSSVLLQEIHPAFGDLNLNFGLTARRVVEAGVTPVVSLGILDVEGTAGRLGGGIFEMPMAPFKDAITALDHSA